MVKGSKPFGPVHVHKLFISKKALDDMMEIELKLENEKIVPYTEIRGNIQVNYKGRYDGVVINTQILNSNELIVYKSYNGKTISRNVSRLFISRDDMPENKATFTASIEFRPDYIHDIKFRVSIIQEHKEIESDVLFAKLVV